MGYEVYLHIIRLNHFLVLKAATRQIENGQMDAKAESKRGIWTRKVHEVALHEASHREGLLKFDRKELLLKTDFG